jgi:hypothetical protein
MSGTASDLERIRSEITADPDNAWAAAANYQPMYVADAAARVAIVGQAIRTEPGMGSFVTTPEERQEAAPTNE